MIRLHKSTGTPVLPAVTPRVQSQSVVSLVIAKYLTHASLIHRYHRQNCNTLPLREVILRICQPGGIRAYFLPVHDEEEQPSAGLITVTDLWRELRPVLEFVDVEPFDK